MKTVHVQFLGASETVTGSKFYLETENFRFLVDCGMFQGLKKLREENWNALPIDVPKLDMVLLTHGHLDHTGYLPRLFQQGFRGKILGTAPTLAIAEIILKDSAKIHEEEADRANKEHYSKHHPAKPFYTTEEAEKTIQLFERVERDEWISLNDSVKARFRYNGHIIGATFIELDIHDKRWVFSGDVGRRNDALLSPPDRPRWADYLFLESTYGNRLHPEEDIEELLQELIMKILQTQGTLLIPSFAVERLQTLMYILWQLYQKNKIPNIPIYIDSPMGTNVLHVFNQFPEWHKLSKQQLQAMQKRMVLVASYRETWETIDNPRPKVVIAGSGMVTGGRILTYLSQLIDRENTSILLVGFQAEGTRGRQLLEGAHELKFFGKFHPVKASVHHIESLSAHADQADLMHWIDNIRNVPEAVYLVHGEPTAMDTLRVKIETEKGWNVHIPKLYESQKHISE
ncbi:MBL fold metallo-hydrolase RNA specificity domain-containing protein [Luteirhabdus pelagi]|uniref:MBL fold metallo-hydrolase RNA specificity domain-containing protein n=1 Tax=Luteirhabdus pelagi TaxID=2792783 RepID=UPI00193AB52D|nr:MBL fold metallo-hydrolase [Luteirhabdus pelagi]